MRGRLVLGVVTLAAMTGCGASFAVPDDPPSAARRTISPAVLDPTTTGAPTPDATALAPPPPTSSGAASTPVPAAESLPPIVPPLTTGSGTGPLPTDRVTGRITNGGASRPVGVPLAPGESRSSCLVTVVGDSLTVAAADDLVASLWASRCQVETVAAKIGASIEYGAGLARDLATADRLTPVVLAALGTNDCSASPAQIDREIESFLAVVGPKRTVVWPTNVVARQTQYCPADGDDVVNARLQAAATRHPNLRIADWSAIAASHPDWYPDGIHLGTDARRTWAGYLADAVASAAAATAKRR